MELEMIVLIDIKQNTSDIIYSKSNYGRHVMMLISLCIEISVILAHWSVGVAPYEAKCELLRTRMRK
jgi:hypothetical protein